MNILNKEKILELAKAYSDEGKFDKAIREYEKILLADPAKKITLSGHTDALGPKDYNESLSGRRAAAVRDLLIAAGVSAEQIVTVAKGSSQPRRPNARQGRGQLRAPPLN